MSLDNTKKVIYSTVDLTDDFSKLGLYLFLFYKSVYNADEVDCIKSFIENIFESSGVDYASLLTNYYCYLDLLEKK